MGLTLAQMREHVYTFFELDTDDVAHSLIDNWAAEGFRKVAFFRPNWPFYDATYDLTTISGQLEYNDSELGNLRSVESVIGPNGPMTVLGYSDAVRLYRQNDSTYREGKPREFARNSSKWYFYPQPDDAYTITAVGYRQPTGFGTDAGSQPDLPDELHDTVLMWIKYRVYLHQDDTELAEIERFNFDESLTSYTEDITATDANYPVIMGGGPWSARRNPNGGPPQPPSDWD